jgi:hypothetical protein
MDTEHGGEMVGMELDHWQVLTKGLAGDRPVDEQTLTSLAILGERLERLKRSHPVLSAVEFSPHVKELSRRAGVVAVS